MITSLPSDWSAVPVPAALDEQKPIIRPSAKIAARDYRPSGRFPIIDQSQNPTAGWTDDEEAVLRVTRPVIVFGDHTRTFKYIDHPFAAGADGTLILNPSNEFEPQFLYFACLSLEIPSRGYNRHYSLLKEMSVPKPSQDEQRNIAAVLGKVQAAVEVERDLISLTGELKQTTLRQLFTRGLRSEPQMQTELGPVPTSWEQVRVDDLGKVVTGTTPKTANRAFYDGGTFDFLAPGDISEGGIDIRGAAKKLTAAGLNAARELPRSSSCFVCIGSSIGKVGITTQQRSAFNQQINAVIPSEDFDPRFVFYALVWNAETIASRASPSPVPIMSKSLFAEAPVWVTRDKDEQREIAAQLTAIDAKLAHHVARQKVLRELFRTLVRDLMTARRRVTRLDLGEILQSSNAVTGARRK
jgi:type I restriction enzyme, S subunit